MLSVELARDKDQQFQCVTPGCGTRKRDSSEMKVRIPCPLFLFIF